MSWCTSPLPSKDGWRHLWRNCWSLINRFLMRTCWPKYFMQTFSSHIETEMLSWLHSIFPSFFHIHRELLPAHPIDFQPLSLTWGQKMMFCVMSETFCSRFNNLANCRLVAQDFNQWSLTSKKVIFFFWPWQAVVWGRCCGNVRYTCLYTYIGVSENASKKSPKRKSHQRCNEMRIMR